MKLCWCLVGLVLHSVLVQEGHASVSSGTGPYAAGMEQRLRGGGSKSPIPRSRAGTPPPLSQAAHMHTGPDCKICAPQVKVALAEFGVRCSDTVPGERLAMMGKGKTLGEWRDPIPMHCDDTWPLWQVKVKLPEDDLVDYKYVKINEEKQIIQWEEGENREIYLTPGSLRENLSVDDGQFGILSKPIYTVSVLVRVRVESV